MSRLILLADNIGGLVVYEVFSHSLLNIGKPHVCGWTRADEPSCTTQWVGRSLCKQPPLSKPYYKYNYYLPLHMSPREETQEQHKNMKSTEKQLHMLLSLYQQRKTEKQHHKIKLINYDSMRNIHYRSRIYHCFSLFQHWQLKTFCEELCGAERFQS